MNTQTLWIAGAAFVLTGLAQAETQNVQTAGYAQPPGQKTVVAPALTPEVQAARVRTAWEAKQPLHPSARTVYNNGGHFDGLRNQKAAPTAKRLSPEVQAARERSAWEAKQPLHPSARTVYTNGGHFDGLKK